MVVSSLVLPLELDPPCGLFVFDPSSEVDADEDEEVPPGLLRLLLSESQRLILMLEVALDGMNRSEAPMSIADLACFRPACEKEEP